MAEEFKPQAVKDVPVEAFIKAYAAHLKANDKVRGRSSVARAPAVEGQHRRLRALLTRLLDKGAT
jgi:ribosomal protein S19E (S16A)